MKTCNRCKRSLPTTSFAKNASKPDGLQGACRECQRLYNREHYPRTKERWKGSRAATRVAIRKANQAGVLQYLLEHPCIDCGIEDIRVLDFDHRGDEPKLANVCELISSARWERIRAEIMKCDVRCRNCHAVKTYERSPSWRSLASEALR